MKNSIKTILLTFVILFAGLSLTAGNTAKAFEVQPTVLTNLEIVNNQVAVSEKFTVVVMDMQGEVVTFEVVSGNEKFNVAGDAVTAPAADVYIIVGVAKSPSASDNSIMN